MKYLIMIGYPEEWEWASSYHEAVQIYLEYMEECESEDERANLRILEVKDVSP